MRAWGRVLPLVVFAAACTPTVLVPAPGVDAGADAAPDVRSDAGATDAFAADVVAVDVVAPVDAVAPTDVVDAVTPTDVVDATGTSDAFTSDVTDVVAPADVVDASVVLVDVADASSPVDAVDVVAPTDVADASAPADVVAPADAGGMPGSIASGREGLAAAVLNDGRVLIAGGRLNGTTGYLDDVEIYDPASERWSAGPRLPARLTSPAVVQTNGGRVYLFGGYNGTQSLTTTYVLDPGATSWRTTAPMSTGRDGARAAVAANGRVYVIGGNALGTTLGSVEVFDPMTERWSAGPALQAARAFGVAVTLPDGRIAAFGGYNTSGGGQHISSVEILDLVMNRWVYGVAMPSTIGLAGGGAVTASDGLVHFLAGSRPGALVATHAVFDPVMGNYRSLAALPAPRGLPGFVEAPRGTLLAIGGSDERGDGTSRVFAYSIASNTWR